MRAYKKSLRLTSANSWLPVRPPTSLLWVLKRQSSILRELQDCTRCCSQCSLLLEKAISFLTHSDICWLMVEWSKCSHPPHQVKIPWNVGKRFKPNVASFLDSAHPASSDTTLSGKSAYLQGRERTQCWVAVEWLAKRQVKLPRIIYLSRIPHLCFWSLFPVYLCSLELLREIKRKHIIAFRYLGMKWVDWFFPMNKILQSLNTRRYLASYGK